jgi:hypothetical protein
MKRRRSGKRKKGRRSVKISNGSLSSWKRKRTRGLIPQAQKKKPSSECDVKVNRQQQLVDGAVRRTASRKSRTALRGGGNTIFSGKHINYNTSAKRHEPRHRRRPARRPTPHNTMQRRSRTAGAARDASHDVADPTPTRPVCAGDRTTYGEVSPRARHHLHLNPAA